ncbi:galanin receptor type 1-like isoform X1 [Montipora capricornis]|uniref:galanin receptor type 1-like isoform X1 n=2 Tax=Montipora capricornis TaxID=246305 RepID=UPI0035F1E260
MLNAIPLWYFSNVSALKLPYSKVLKKLKAKGRLQSVSDTSFWKTLARMASQSSNNSSQQLSQSDQYTERTMTLVIIFIIISVGIIGNSMVIAVVKAIRGMRSTTNYLLVNIALADIITLLFTIVHFILSRFSSPPSFTSAALNFLCKFIYTNNVSLVSFLVTVMTLTLLAIERYQALVKPLTSSRRLTSERIACVITGIWSASFALVTPLFATTAYKPDDKEICSHGDAREGIVIYIYCFVVILALIPFTIIMFCYSFIIYGMYINKTIFNNNGERRATRQEITEKRRLVWLLIILTLIFFVAFIPYGILLIMKYSEVNNAFIIDLHYATQYLTLLNFAVNPFIYAFASSGYRRGYVFLLKKITCRNTTVNAIELREMQLRTSVRTM